MSSFSVRGRSFVLAGVAALVAGIGANPPALAQTKSPKTAAPVEIGGQYTIYFNGFNIGDVRLDQRHSGRSYIASSTVELSALLGAFHWKGETRVAGTVSGGVVRPSGYDFDFAGSSASGLVRMRFDEAGVSELTALPETPSTPDFVPISRPHVKGVIDPLSALVMMSRPSSGSPCGRKLALFDGKQRFDVALVLLRKEQIASSPGQPLSEGVVCRVRYTPVAGYRNTAETRALADSQDIEVSMRSVPQAGIWVPYRVKLPTMAGAVTIEAQRIDVAGSGDTEIALVD